MEEIRKKLNSICGTVRENVPFSSLTSFKTGGPARYLLSPSDMQEAEAVLSFTSGNSIPLLVMGNGTNVLVSDEGFEGIVLSTQRLNRMTVEDESVVCESGVQLTMLVKTSLARRLTGAEFLAGIPGTVGGAVLSNAGLKKLWLSEIIQAIEVIPLAGGGPHTIPRKEINFGYRASGLEGIFISKVKMLLKQGNAGEIKKTVSGYMKERMLRQPLEHASAGSVFKNPPGFFAGEMIEKCGLKGLCRGEACISEKHANFIVTGGNAKSGDIYAIIKDVREKVKKVYNIELELEIKLIGKF